MSLFRYNVTRIRAAACCPRIHYFDAENQRQKRLKNRPLTMIWTEGDSTAPGGGKAFHTVVERFNRIVGASPLVRSALDARPARAELHRALMRFINTDCIDHEKLKESPIALRQHLVKALTAYIEEVAGVLERAAVAGIKTAESMDRLFGDDRKRVDTTFHVGDGARVHVTGVVDYVYQDPTTGQNRIVDYKLTPPTHPNKDLMQVMTYALMHHHQHGTKPDIAVYYLHPKQKTVQLEWQKVRAERRKVYDLLASMVLWEDYQEKTGHGLKPPGDVTYCPVCKWSPECEQRLGPKAQGQWDRRWQSLTGAAGRDPEPPSEVVRPPRSIPPAELEEGRVEEEEIDAPVPGKRERGRPEEDVAKTQVSPVHRAAGSTYEKRPAVSAQDERARTMDSASGAIETAEAVAQSVPRLELGAVCKGESTAIAMARETLNTHVAVVGAAGSGKTWMAKVIAEEAILAGVPVLAVDPQGDLVQFLRARAESEVPAESRSRYRLFWQRVEPRVYTPGTSHAMRLSLDPVRLPSRQDLAAIADPRRREEERHAMLSAVANNLVALGKAGGEVDSQRNFLFQLLLAMPEGGQISLERIVEALHEPDQLGIDEPERFVKKAEREKLARKLHGFVRGPSAGLFEGGRPLDLNHFRTATSPGKVPLNVIYLNALTDDDQKHFFVATLASEIYRWMITSLDASQKGTNLLFYLDEARDYIPAGGRQPPAKEPLIRLFTQGRKYGVGCLLCTQSPRAVDYNVFGNCSTKIIGRMEAAQDIERIVEWFSVSGSAPAWVARRKGAERGTFVGRWPEMPTGLSGKPFQSRLLFSSHEGAWSPDRLEREIAAQRGNSDIPAGSPARAP